MIKKYTALFIPLIFSCSYLDAMNALMKKQDEVAGKILKSQRKSEEEELQEAIQASMETAEKEKKEILAAGVYTKDVPITINNSAVNFGVQQIAVTNPQSSENITCGPRVLFIAAAIDQLYENKIPINQNSIATILSQNNNYTNAIETCKEQLDYQDIKNFIEKGKVNISKYFVMGRVGDASMIVPYVPLIVDRDNIQNFETSLKKLGAELKSDLIKPIHFIFSDIKKAHWILISVMKEKDSDPVLYYIDPKNKDLTSYPVARDYIQYVVEKLGLPFAKN